VPNQAEIWGSIHNRTIVVGVRWLALANLLGLNYGKPQKAQVLGHLILALAYIFTNNLP
jgi:hypothetical protein